MKKLNIYILTASLLVFGVSCEKGLNDLNINRVDPTSVDPAALLNNAQRSFQLFGKPRVDAEKLLAWVADWVKRGKGTLGKPTHFESRDGKF